MDHVVVVGAGIGGLAASLTLCGVAQHVTLIERVDHPREVGAALALQANGLAVLRRLGLLAAVERAGSHIDRLTIRNPAGAVLLRAAVPDLGGGLDHALAVSRSHLHSVLLDAVYGHDSIRTVFGATVVSADPGGSLVLRSGHGEAATTTTVAADVVIGADGVNSVVRSTGGFASTVSPGSSYVRAVVHGQAHPGFEEFWTPLGSFGRAPLGPDNTYFWAAAHSPTVAEAINSRDVSSFADKWTQVLPLAGDLLSKVHSFDELLVNTVRRVNCRRWFSGRLVLLGDAAHAMAPNLGQGANSALTDAVALAAALTTTAPIPAALQLYDRRRPAARRVQNIAGLLDHLSNMRQFPAVQIRDGVLGAIARFPQLGETATRRALADDVAAIRSATIWNDNPPGA